MNGLRTAAYEVEDLAAARDWYTSVLGFGPYFDEPFYVGFNVGGFELGLVPVEERATLGRGGTTAYWGVDDAHAAYRRLLELGATELSPLLDVGGDILVGSVLDPFGNIFGVIYNPHFKIESQ